MTLEWSRVDRRCWVASDSAGHVLHVERLVTGEGWLPWFTELGEDGVEEIRGPVERTRAAAQARARAMSQPSVADILDYIESISGQAPGI